MSKRKNEELSVGSYLVGAMWFLLKFLVTIAIAVPVGGALFVSYYQQVMTGDYAPADAALTIFNQGINLGAGGVALGIGVFYAVWQLVESAVEFWSMWKARQHATNT